MRIAITCIQLIRDLDQYRPDLTAAGLDVTVPEIPGQHLEGDELVAALAGCAGVIAGDDRFTASVLNHCPDLRTISKWGVGIDGIDLAAAAERGIRVTNTPGVFDDEVADVAMAYITMLARSLHVIDRGVHGGEWPKPAGRSLRGATLGIVGLGGIGRALAVRAAAAGMVVVGTDPSTQSAELASALGVTVRSFVELLAGSEFISVNCPLNESTLHLFDDAAFGQIRPGAYLVNTGRGAVVATDAIVKALASGRLAGAALDVMEEEPPPPDSPLRELAHVILGSHNGSNTLQASARVHVMAIDNLVTSLGVAIPDPMNERRIVLITGAAGAIGGATARAFLGEGWHVVGLDRRPSADPGSCSEFIVDDVADETLPARLLAHPDLAVRLDALVNNAAIQVDQPLVDTTDDTWRHVMSTNVDAAFRLIRTFHGHLAASRGAIVNVSSVHALATSPNVAAYAVSKAALAGLTRTAALELALHGIRCNAVLPGAVMSDMLRAGLSRRPHPEGPQGNLDALVGRTPLGFVAAPEQIAPSIVFLADGERSGYTTGQLLVVDGGAMIRLGTE